MSLFLWQSKRAAELRERRKHQNKCERCGLFYFKTEEKCPHCSNLKDYQLKLLLKKRMSERLSLGRGMLIAAVAIIILMFLI